MDNELTRYVNDHLAGSSGALLLVDEIASHHDDPEARLFFAELKDKIREDRDVLDGLLKRIAEEPSALMKVAGGIAARVGGLKLMWEKVEPGKLGMFEALEMLTLGIQGKRLLWTIMREIQPWFPEWTDLNFQELELEAIRQRDEVEEWRVRAGIDSLVSAERKSAAGDI
ncbi:MAG: hypothetical protein EOP87_06390 [Verrucomicrobiaceae bacterium]|nr:MAG: hypothetical protein EOP87_06390 [Verrucomicrobiaceae bacterium]